MLFSLAGFFSYNGDNQEADIEILTAHPEGGAHFTNQPVIPGASATTTSAPLPPDATTRMHEYRIDWQFGLTRFYLDGVLQHNLTDNVPSTGSKVMVNNWRYVFRHNSLHGHGK